MVNELGEAFNGTGDDLGQIIDTLDVVHRDRQRQLRHHHQLIKDSNIVLQTQLDKASAIRSFAKNLALVSDTLAGGDADLRTSSPTASPRPTSCARSSRRTRSTSAS